MVESRRDLEALQRVVAMAHDEATAPVAPEIHAEGRSRLITVASNGAYLARPKLGPRRIIQGAAGLAAAAALVLAATSYLRTRPLTYEIHGGSELESSYLRVPPDSPAEVRFSDGTEIEADPGARLRIDETRSNGARILLEQGTAAAHVRHGEHSSWLFVAGPFEVHVTGTKLRLSWDPAKEEIDLTLQEGSVEVDSPLARGPVAVRSRQRLRASLIGRTMALEDLAPAGDRTAQTEPGAALQPIAPSPSPPPAAPSPVGAEPPPAAISRLTGPPPPTSPAEPRARSRAGQAARRADEQAAAPSTANPSTSDQAQAAGRESWSSLVARGEFRAVVAAARARGIDACLSGCSANDVRALADAARYTEQPDLAERCLRTLRDRFPSTRQSAAAAFLLGRTEESRNHMGPAERWYDVYLAEAPNGEFAADALAGQMRTVAALKGADAARPVALEYLRRYPDGVHAPAARNIAEPR